jgi:translation initiation factor 4G
MPLTRTASTGGPAASRERTRSKRGEKRNEGNKLGNSAQSQAAAMQNHHMSFEIVAPFQATANRWDRKTPQAQADGDSPEMVERKVKGLLNKLTMEKFDSISDQIISWANKSENEKDGRTLIQVIKLVFEKATDEATWSDSETYARLCRKMMEQISSKVQDAGIKNNEGKPITCGQSFPQISAIDAKRISSRVGWQRRRQPPPPPR